MPAIATPIAYLLFPTDAGQGTGRIDPAVDPRAYAEAEADRMDAEAAEVEASPGYHPEERRAIAASLRVDAESCREAARNDRTMRAVALTWSRR